MITHPEGHTNWGQLTYRQKREIIKRTKRNLYREQRKFDSYYRSKYLKDLEDHMPRLNPRQRFIEWWCSFASPSSRGLT